MAEPYYSDDQVTLYHGDCREVTEWLAADVLVTDPPYGRAWRQDALPGWKNKGRPISGDESTASRDVSLAAWGAERPAAIFGDLLIPAPAGTKQALIYRKPRDAGMRGAVAGFRRDVEAVFLLGAWSTGIGGTSSVIETGIGGLGTYVHLSGHPHAKPIDVLEALLRRAANASCVADPFAGSGSTLVAARNLGRKAIGVEIDEAYCEIAAKRLAAGVLPLVVTNG